jgi:hypothetical protein
MHERKAGKFLDVKWSIHDKQASDVWQAANYV